MTIEQQEQLTVVAKELFGKDHRPMLTHIDPHLGNFIYDTETKRASALDWDSATFTSEARMLGRIYHFFSQYSAETGQVRDLLFRNFLAGYKDDPESHESAYNTAIYSATIDFYSHLNSFVTKYTKERGVAPELPQLPLLESTLVGRIKHNLKLIESKKWPTPSL
jgi:aminoglycoside phosphotransferase (APT) family kinase protein